MKRRYRHLLNFFAISLLLVALYLNFVKKEVVEVSSPAIKASITNSANPDNNESKTLSPKQSVQTVVLK